MACQLCLIGWTVTGSKGFVTTIAYFYLGSGVHFIILIWQIQSSTGPSAFKIPMAVNLKARASYCNFDSSSCKPEVAKTKNIISWIWHKARPPKPTKKNWPMQSTSHSRHSSANGSKATQLRSFRWYIESHEVMIHKPMVWSHVWTFQVDWWGCHSGQQGSRFSSCYDCRVWKLQPWPDMQEAQASRMQ